MGQDDEKMNLWIHERVHKELDASCETYLALSRANSASNLSLQAMNVSIVTGSP